MSGSLVDEATTEEVEGLFEEEEEEAEQASSQPHMDEGVAVPP